MTARRRSPRVRIVPAGVGDLPAIARLAAEIWHLHYPGIISRAQIAYMLPRMYDLRLMESEIRYGGIAYFRLLADGRLVGYMSCGPARRGQECWLHKVYVHPRCQRRGLGSQLIRRAETWARRRACRTLVLRVNRRNRAAIAAYRKNGFRVREKSVEKIGRGFVMDDYILAKEIPSRSHGRRAPASTSPARPMR